MEHGRAGFPCSHSYREPALPWPPPAPAGAREWRLRAPTRLASASGPLQLFSLLEHFFDGPLHVESLLGNFIVFALGDFTEALARIRQLHVFPGESGELLGHVERLREEPLNLARARHRQLVFIGEFVDTQDGDDVLQVLITLQDSFDNLSAIVVVLAED